jgi:uncharacterized protein YjiS (DUF1127 family)
MITMLTSKCSLAGRVSGPEPRRKAAAALIVTPLLDRLSIWFERARQRRQLYALDDHVLKDIGLSRADVEFETRKHFWMP